MKTYVGKFEDGKYQVVIEDDDGIGRINYRELPLRLDLVNKSPTGFSWGYNGSGPAQLALSLLADAVGDEEALKMYQSFKYVQKLSQTLMSLTQAVCSSTSCRTPNSLGSLHNL